MHHGKFGKMIEKLKRTYSGKRVFITGHTGFKGAWLTQFLLLLGANVKGLALEPEYENSLFDLLTLNSECDSIIGDIRDFESLSREISTFSPDFIFHLAAQPLVRKSYESPIYTYEVNVNGTINILESLKKIRNKCQVIFVTTDKVYYNYEWVYPYRESDRLGGYDPYSASKACAELVIESYRNSFFNISEYQKHLKSISVARAGNVIGGGDWSVDRLIPDIVKSLVKNDTVIIRNPTSIRPWQHVLEPLLGYLILGSLSEKEPAKFSQAYNFGPYTSDSIAVEKMVQIAINKWGSGAYKVITNLNAPHEAGLLKLDINKSISELEWKPKYDAVEALAKTLDWYKVYFDNSRSLKQFTKSQILDFISNV